MAGKTRNTVLVQARRRADELAGKRREREEKLKALATEYLTETMTADQWVGDAQEAAAAMVAAVFMCSFATPSLLRQRRRVGGGIDVGGPSSEVRRGRVGAGAIATARPIGRAAGRMGACCPSISGISSTSALCSPDPKSMIRLSWAVPCAKPERGLRRVASSVGTAPISASSSADKTIDGVSCDGGARRVAVGMSTAGIIVSVVVAAPNG